MPTKVEIREISESRSVEFEVHCHRIYGSADEVKTIILNEEEFDRLPLLNGLDEKGKLIKEIFVPALEWRMKAVFERSCEEDSQPPVDYFLGFYRVG